MLQVPLKSHSTESFLARVTCEAKDLRDNAVTEGYTAEPIAMLRASPETLHGKITFDAPMNLDPAGEWTPRIRQWC